MRLEESIGRHPLRVVSTSEHEHFAEADFYATISLGRFASKCLYSGSGLID